MKMLEDYVDTVWIVDDVKSNLIAAYKGNLEVSLGLIIWLDDGPGWEEEYNKKKC